MKPTRNRAVLSEINVTPLVDVMLVLLIIFMVTAPLLQQGLDVNLPKAKGRDLPTEDRITLLIKKDRTLYLNDKPVSVSALRQKLSAVSKLNPNVFLKADRDVSYGLVAEIMGEVKEAGIEKLGMITEPAIQIR